MDEEMIDEESDYLDLCKKVKEYTRELKGEKEKCIEELTTKITREFENKEKKLQPIRQFLQKTKADKNSFHFRMDKYISDVIVGEEQGYERMEKERNLLIGEFYNLDHLEREIKMRIGLSTSTFSNKGNSTDNK